jgi:DNA-binding transcriptional MerR regulator
VSDDDEKVDNVIHVRFGPERRLASEVPKAVPRDGRRPRERAQKRDPLTDVYSRREVARLFGLTVSRLKYWQRSGFLAPSARDGRRRFYTFQDLIGIRAAKGLLDAGVPLQKVRRTVEAIHASLPKVTSPLSELRVVADGSAVLVKSREGAFEPTTGQLVLDFEVEALKDDVVRVLRSGPTPAERRTAYEHYLEGCRLDEDEATFDEAEAAYRRALAADPSLANALTNLGNVRYRRGAIDEAEMLYNKALGVDPEQPEAYYNLGFLHYERGEPDEAVALFETALRHDPAFGDAHFNLAMALEELGESARARGHWLSYLELEPQGAWADIARRHLDR